LSPPSTCPTVAVVDMTAISSLQKRQARVIARHQVLEHQGCDNEIERRLRRREWARVHPGVYVDHTGPLAWKQRAWAALMYAGPAALAGRSAIRAHDLQGPARARDRDPIEIAVAESRRVTPPDGVLIRRLVDFDALTQRHLSPPRVRIEHALLTVASAQSSDDGAVAVLADGCQSRRTTAGRLAELLRGMPRLPRRRLLLEIIDDVGGGAFSALERRYLTQVERAHAFPPGARQARVDLEGVIYRDVEYPCAATFVELDGRLGHEWTSERWDDLDRDVSGAETGSLTLRLGWKQVLDPCRLAAAVARVLRARGWSDRPVPCSAACPVGDVGGSPAPGAGDPPVSPAA